MRKNEGITLIALVVTIIVLIILAAVSLNILLGQNGIITKAQDAAKGTREANGRELIAMAVMASYDNTGSLNRTDLARELGKIEGLEVIGDIATDNPIKVKLNGYEYEIDAQGKVTTNGESAGGTANPTTPETIAKDGTWDEKKGVNSPDIREGMTAVYYDNGTWKELNDSSSKDDWKKWYDYKEQTGTEDGLSNWANATTLDGSFWVWIPRFEYKIDSTGATGDSGIVGTGGTIYINFISRDTVTPTSGYTIHPAFLGIGSENAGGGFGTDSKGIPGFWIAKYEMSQENSSGKNVNTNSSTIGNVELGSNVKMVSKPGVRSWRNINIANCYNNSKAYNTAKESHLIKNSEWGAVAYLTHSKYGRNGKEITINDSASYVTGGGTGTTYITKVDQSSTGNVYGIYDLSGNAYEYVAGYNKAYAREGDYFGGATGNTNTTYRPVSGSHFAYTLNGSSDKFVTAYNNSSGASNATTLSDFTDGRDVSHTGDAIHEVWVKTRYGWFSDDSSFVYSAQPFFRRGGLCGDGSDAGVFSSGNDGGDAFLAFSFRVVCTK